MLRGLASMTWLAQMSELQICGEETLAAGVTIEI